MGANYPSECLVTRHSYTFENPSENNKNQKVTKVMTNLSHIEAKHYLKQKSQKYV